MCFDPISYDKAEKARKHSKNVQEQLLDYIAQADVSINNKVVNGDFSDGMNNWNKGVYSGAISVADNIMTINNGTHWYFGVYQNTEQLKAGNKYYMAFDVYSENFELVKCARAQYADSAYENAFKLWDIGGLENGRFHRLSSVGTTAIDSNIFKIGFQAITADAQVAVKCSNVLLIDLTEAFGAGSEPTQKEMDILINLIPAKWWDGTLRANNKLVLNWQRERLRLLEHVVKFEISPRLAEIMEHDFVVTIGYDDASASIYEYAFPVHQAHDVPGTFFVTTGMVEGEIGVGSWGSAVTWEQLREMHNSEVGTITVGHHSHRHFGYGGATPEQLHSDLKTSMDIFLREGFKPKYMAYPGGSSSILAQQYVSAYFKAARGAYVHPGFDAGQNGSGTNRYYIDSVGIDNHSVASIKGYITRAKNREEKVWLNVFMHMVHPSGQSTSGGTVKTPEELNEIIQFVKDSNGLILSYDDAINVFMENYYWTEHKAFQVKQFLI